MKQNSKDYDIKQIGAKIRESRLEKRMTIEQLAKAVGLSYCTMNYYENGRIGSMPLNRLKDIADALDVAPEYLLGWDKTSNQCAVVQIKLEMLDDNELFQVSNYIDFLLSKRLQKENKPKE